MKHPLPHNFISQYISSYEKKGLIKYYEYLIKFKEKEINEIKQIIKDLEK